MSNSNLRFVLFGAVLILAWGCSSSTLLSPAGTVTVGVNGDFANVQSAIDASPPGTRVEISGSHGYLFRVSFRDVEN